MKTDGTPYSEEEALRMEEIDGLQKELAAMEAENAALREALTDLIRTCESEDVMEYGETPDRQTIRDAKAVLEPDRGKGARP